MKRLSIACLAAAAAPHASNVPHRTRAPKMRRSRDLHVRDNVLDDQVTSGGLRVIYWQPAGYRAGDAGSATSAIARSRRRVAGSSGRGERVQHRTKDREQSPFSHRKQIAQSRPTVFGRSPACACCSSAFPADRRLDAQDIDVIARAGRRSARFPCRPPIRR